MAQNKSKAKVSAVYPYEIINIKEKSHNQCYERVVRLLLSYNDFQREHWSVPDAMKIYRLHKKSMENIITFKKSP